MDELAGDSERTDSDEEGGFNEEQGDFNEEGGLSGTEEVAKDEDLGRRGEDVDGVMQRLAKRSKRQECGTTLVLCEIPRILGWIMFQLESRKKNLQSLTA
jgi:hypothetical protein